MGDTSLRTHFVSIPSDAVGSQSVGLVSPLVRPVRPVVSSRQRLVRGRAGSRLLRCPPPVSPTPTQADEESPEMGLCAGPGIGRVRRPRLAGVTAGRPSNGPEPVRGRMDASERSLRRTWPRDPRVLGPRPASAADWEEPRVPARAEAAHETKSTAVLLVVTV